MNSRATVFVYTHVMANSPFARSASAAIDAAFADRESLSPILEPRARFRRFSSPDEVADVVITNNGIRNRVNFDV